MTVVYIVVKISIVYVHLSRISTQPYLMKAAADERNRSPRQSSVSARPKQGHALDLGLGPLCFYFCAIMLVTIMLSEFAILDRDYATYMLA